MLCSPSHHVNVLSVLVQRVNIYLKLKKENKKPYETKYSAMSETLYF